MIWIPLNIIQHTQHSVENGIISSPREIGEGFSTTIPRQSVKHAVILKREIYISTRLKSKKRRYTTAPTSARHVKGTELRKIFGRFSAM